MNPTLENLIRCPACAHGAAFHFGGRCDTAGCRCRKSDRDILSAVLRSDGKRRYDGYYGAEELEPQRESARDRTA
jgi:hypothetical protein